MFTNAEYLLLFCYRL